MTTAAAPAAPSPLRFRPGVAAAWLSMLARSWRDHTAGRDPAARASALRLLLSSLRSDPPPTRPSSPFFRSVHAIRSLSRKGGAPLWPQRLADAIASASRDLDDAGRLAAVDRAFSAVLDARPERDELADTLNAIARLESRGNTPEWQAYRRAFENPPADSPIHE